jgi:hypothetical protein
MMQKVIYLILILLLSSCIENEILRDDQIPYVYVFKEINLHNQQYNNLRFDRGFVYENGGFRGLIIYRENSTTYRVFERACPHDPMNENEKVEVDDSGFFMHDKSCGSVFDFFGNPTNGPSRRPMRQYLVFLSGSMMTIASDP